jgi:hypothetical protein
MEMEGINYKMRELYKNIELELDKVKYKDLWPGFSRMEFAIYNKTKIFLKKEEIPYDERFLGNTSIDYNGSNLAIWYTENPSQEESRELASNIIHEMFHSYQITNNEVRFPDDLKGLDYPMDLKNYEIKYKENILLVEALNSNDRNIKYNILKEIISLRMLRLRKYGDIIKYEFAIETVEGSAEYCGTKALRDISKELYDRRIENYKKILTEDISIIFNVRKICYYTGALFLFLLEELDIPFTREISGQNEYIFEEILDKCAYDIINIDDIKSLQIEKHFIEYINERENKFEDFFNKSFVKHEGDFYICGYDPMNMIKQEEQVLCSHFIVIMDKVSKEQLFLNGPVVVKLKKGTSNHVVEYYSKVD